MFIAGSVKIVFSSVGETSGLGQHTAPSMKDYGTGRFFLHDKL
jgi:hypothetical protein